MKLRGSSIRIIFVSVQLIFLSFRIFVKYLLVMAKERNQNTYATSSKALLSHLKFTRKITSVISDGK